jgi:hypothetical protein
MTTKLNIYLIKMLLISGALLSFGCANVFAVDVEVSEAKINKKLNESFPRERAFDGVKAQFTSPQILLNPLDETIKIATLIESQHGGFVFLAKGNLEGPLEYDEMFKVLQMRKPVLRDFKVVESDMPEHQLAKTSKTIQQSMGNNLPRITLVDLDNFEIMLPRTGPKSIDVGPRRLIIEL